MMCYNGFDAGLQYENKNPPNENVNQVAVPGDHDVLKQREATLTGSENTMVLSYYFVLQKH